jgi:selenide,water dikinase
VVSEILKGGLEACEEAGCALMGGHTIKDEEVKYGLAVTGVALPDEIITNAGAKPGDMLVLTKPIGTGIMSTAVKKGVAPKRGAQASSASMATLNLGAFQAMNAVGVNACTDITGFGLAGHASQMASASGVTFIIDTSTVPLLPGVLALARKDMLPGGSKNNLKAYRKRAKFSKQVDTAKIDVIFDAQTSGGLLMSVPENKAKKLVAELKKRKTPAARIIGKVAKKIKSKDIVLE